MAETTVHALKASVILDTAGLTRGANLTRSELSSLRSTFRQLTTDEERQAKQLYILEKAYRDGVITAKQFEVAQQRLAEKARKTTREIAQQGKMSQQFSGAGQFLPGAGMLGRFAGLGPGAAAVGGAALGAGAAVGVVKELTELTIKQSEYAVALADTADKIGATVGGLRGLQAAAELTGVDARTTAMGLQRMTRRIAEASHGTGEAQGALRELGLNAVALAKLRPEDQFIAIADAMEGVNSKGDQLRLAFKLFDSEGAALVNTLRMGREELEQQRDRFGDLFSEQAIANSRLLQENLANMRIIFEEMALTIANKLTPAVSGFLQAGNEALGGKAAGVEGQAVKKSLRNSLIDFLAGAPGAGELIFGSASSPATELASGPIEEQVRREGETRRARERQQFFLDRAGRGAAGGVNALGRVGGPIESAISMAGGLLSQAGAAMEQQLREEIDQRRGHLAELQAAGKEQVAMQKRFNASLEQNLLAPDLTQQAAKQMEVEAIARQRFGGQAFDVKKTEQNQKEATEKLTAEIKKLVQALQNPASLNTSGEKLGIIPSLEALLNG